MKVVIPVGALHIGGGCRVLAEVANALASAGHDTEVVIPEGMPIEYALHCKITKVPSLAKEYIPFGDIVLPNFYTTFQGPFAAWPKQCVRLSLGFEPLWVPDAEYAIWTYQQGVPTISISHWLDDQIFMHSHQRGSVVNLGIDRAVFHPKGQKMQRSRKIILYLARDPQAGYELKGYDDFVQAMKILKRHYSKKFAVYMICPERDLPLSGIPHRIFHPKTDRDIAKLYRTADVFVSTSWFEGFALPPLEAMACGTPVVTTDSGGIRDFCFHRQNAYIVQPKDARKIAHGIQKVLTNEKFAKTLGSTGVKSSKQFTSGRFARRMVTTLETIYYNR